MPILFPSVLRRYVFEGSIGPTVSTETRSAKSQLLNIKMRMTIMEANLQSAIKNSECRELRTDELDSVSGGEVRTHAHMNLPGVDININWVTGIANWKFWRGSTGEY